MIDINRDLRAFLAPHYINMFDKMKPKKVIRKISRLLLLDNGDVYIAGLYDKLDKATRAVRRKQDKLQIFQQRYHNLMFSHLTKEQQSNEFNIVW